MGTITETKKLFFGLALVLLKTPEREVVPAGVRGLSTIGTNVFGEVFMKGVVRGRAGAGVLMATAPGP